MQSLTQQFADFCRSKPADEEYDYMDNCGCALFHFMTAAGYPVDDVAGDWWTDIAGREHKLPESLAVALCRLPWTFGALADRLEAAR